MAETLDFLLEIGTEEMPSAPLMNAAGQLGGLVAKGLDSAGLAHGEVRVISSPPSWPTSPSRPTRSMR